MFKIVVLMFLSSCSLIGLQREKTPPFETIKKENDFEIRKYQAMNVAITKIDKSRNEAFRKLANYIFSEKINMTAPVIEMTSPVIEMNNKTPEMAFYLPQELNQLPKPQNKNVSLKTIPEKTFGVIRYSWFNGDEKKRKKSAELTEWINQQKIWKIISAPIFTYYNPPWTLPFMKHHEIWIELTSHHH